MHQAKGSEMMLRKSLLEISQNDWEPTIPSEKSVVKQVNAAKGKIAGSVHLAMGEVAVSSGVPSKPRMLYKYVKLMMKDLGRSFILRSKGL